MQVLKKNPSIFYFNIPIVNDSYFCIQGPRQDSYRYAVTPGDEGGNKKKGKKGKKADMDELKQELTMDEHKIPLTELYSRLCTDPNVVSDNGLKQDRKSV